MASRIPADIQRNKAVDFDRQDCRRYTYINNKNYIN